MIEKICLSCGVHSSDGAKFCAHCGSSLTPKPKLCGACGTANDLTAQYCIECGRAFAAAISTARSTDAPGALLTAAFPVAATPVPELAPRPPAPPQAGGMRDDVRPTRAASSGAEREKSTRRELSDKRLAAIAIWILCLIAIFIAVVKGGASHEQVLACTAAGGAGSGCQSGPLWGKIVWVVAVLGSAVGARLWSRN